MSLTEIQAKQAKPKDKPYKLAAGHGLYLLVNPNGSKIWRMKYRIGGKERLLSFGKYPAISISAARQKQVNAKAALIEGRDPGSKFNESSTPAVKSFRHIAEMWHANRKSSLVEAHAARVWSRLENDVLPSLGDRDIGEITPPEILKIVRKIEERGALDISRRAKQSISQIFRFAIASGWTTSDPTIGLDGALKPKPRVQHMSALPVAELPDFLLKLDNYDEDGSRRAEVTKRALQLILLTWVRTTELRLVTAAEFENLETEEPLWRIPASRMKMGREHLVPLSQQASKIVRRLIKESTSPYLFQGLKGDKPISENTMIFALYRLGYHSRQTVHGFRRLASTWANEQLVEYGEQGVWIKRYHEDWIELQLAHSEKNAVRGAYNAAEYIKPRRLMMQDWADYLDELKLGLGK